MLGSKLMIAGVAMVIVVPGDVGMAPFINEYAPAKIRPGVVISRSKP
jgi:ABC-type phosphate transport system permease subunit